MPARIASCTPRSVTAAPSIRTSPACGCNPNSAIANSVRPDPSSPATPTISPGISARSTPATWPGTARPRASSRGGTPGGGGVHAARDASGSCPVMARVIAASEKSRMAPPAATRPLRITVRVSAISSISRILWLTNSTEMPAALSAVTRSNSRSTSWWVSAVVGSSMISSFASDASARAMATSCRPATGSRPTSRPSGSGVPSRAQASSAICRIRRGDTVRRMRASSGGRARFSATVRFGNREKSW